MRPQTLLFLFVATLTAGCETSQSPAPEPAAETRSEATAPSGPRLYVTNEVSGDLSVIDATTQTVIKTIPLGKRPRGIQISPDKTKFYVALSGSPIAGPGVDESKLPPPDR